MNKIHKLFFLLLAGLILSCSKDNGESTEPLRDYAEQYVTDLAAIDDYLDTHYMTVDTDLQPTFTEIPEGGSQVSIRNQTDYPLQFKMVNKNDVDYKLYYLNFREGTEKRPSRVDSVFVAYKGNLLSDTQFEAVVTPVWFTLDGVVPGWQEIVPFFKTGTFDAGTGENPVTFADFGSGAMFIPSGLGYFGQLKANIPRYSPLIFSFKLYNQRYRDHDRDGVLSKDEVANPGDKPEDYDSDDDEIPNYYDIDDDGDHLQTKNEIHKDLDGNIIFEDCDGDGIPNYLDPNPCT